MAGAVPCDDRSGFRKAVIILNPMADRGRARHKRTRLETGAREAGTRIAACEIRETDAAGDARRLAREAVEDGADLLIAAGGDGTLHDVLNGAIDAHATFGLLPLGTGNDFARSFACGTSLDAWLNALRVGRVVAMDVGVANGQSYLNVAGCGFDAQVAHRINSGVRFLHGTTAYVAAVGCALAALRSARVRLLLDARRVEADALLCAIANGVSYGGGMRIAPCARWDDGLLDVCLVLACSRTEFLAAFPRVFRGAHLSHRSVLNFRARHVMIEADPPWPLLVDGELAGETPAEFVVKPRAIRFLSPQ